MKKIRSGVAAVLALALFWGCKKDKDPVPALTPVGKWEGTFISNAVTLMINRADGSCRFYVLQFGFDTSSTTLKFYGTFKVKNNIFYGDYTDSAGTQVLHAETSRFGSNFMSGVAILSVLQEPAPPAPGAALPFEVYRQP